MNRVISFFVITILFLTLNLAISAQKQERTNIIKIFNTISTEFASAEAFSDGNGVWFKWQMEVESNNLGFNVYRINGSNKEQVNPYLISGGFLQNGEETFPGGNYTFFDPKGSFGQMYLIETLAINGQKTVSIPIFAKYTDNLVGIAGNTSDQLINETKKADFRIEKNEFSLTKELHREIAENALPPNLDRQRLIADQPGVKIGVKKEGIYRVSRTELENAGFDLNSPSANWQLYMNGNEQAIIVGNGDDYIEFYGQGIDTIESGTQIYFLINGAQAGKRIQPSVRRRLAGNVVSNSYEQSFYRADRLLYFSSLRNGGANNFFSDKIIGTAGVTVTFDLDGIDQSITETVLTIGVQGVTATPHNINITLNNVPLAPMTGSNLNLMTKTYQIPTSLLIEGSNSILFKVPTATNDVSLVESVKVNYSRNYLAKQNALSFYAKPLKQFEVKGFTSNNFRVLDTTYPDAPTVVTNLQQTEDNGNFGVIIPANRSRKFFAAAQNAVLSIDTIEENTPSLLTNTNYNAALIIITHKNWMNEAEDWADYRINQGFSVKIVRVDDIFDEFNYGITSANSIRSFLQFAKNNWQTPPNYVLILGDASWDPRGYTTNPFANFVPTKMFDTAYEETGSDEALADFNDDGLAELAVGRIPAKTAADVTRMLNKVSVFEVTSHQGFSRGALFASDLPNGYDFAGMSQRLANELPVATTSVMVNRADTNARTTLLAELNNGRFLVNYSGHGAPNLWAATNFYSSADVPSMANGTNYSVFTMLTCLNGYFLAANNDSLAELVLKAQNGGGVAVWASSGKTTPDVQEVLARRFYQKTSEGNMTRIGDLIKDAKMNVFGGRDVRLSWTLLGDPLLKVR